METDDETPEAVHAYWFGSETDDRIVGELRAQLWWRKHAGVDGEIRLRFGGLVERARDGGLDGWAATPRGLLSLVLVTDQFPRHVHRDTRWAFASDATARRWCRYALERGLDAGYRPIERVFLYLPLEHSESPLDQQESVARFTALARSVEPRLRALFDGYLDFAIRHRDIVARFGRFPHRNAILGRESSAEERAFLTEPGSSF